MICGGQGGRLYQSLGVGLVLVLPIGAVIVNDYYLFFVTFLLLSREIVIIALIL